MPSLRKPLSLVVSVLVLQLGVNGWALESAGPLPGAPNAQAGVVVESVDTEFEAEKDGIKPGDVIDGWSNATERGTIDSPFDLTWVEIEKKPRGLLVLEGFHGTERQTWKFVTDLFGVKVRPKMRERLASAYEEGTTLAKSGKLTEAAELWRGTATATTDEDPGKYDRSLQSLRKSDRRAREPIVATRRRQRGPLHLSSAKCELLPRLRCLAHRAGKSK